MEPSQRQIAVQQRKLVDRESKKKKKQRLVQERCCLVFAALLAGATGVLVVLDHLVLVAVSCIGTLCFTALFLKCADVEFGVIGVTAMQFLVDFLLVVFASIGIFVGCLIVTRSPLPHVPVVVGLVVVSMVMLLRTFSSFGVVCVTIIATLILGFGNAGKPITTDTIITGEKFQVIVGLYACIAGCSFFSRYKQDQCTCCLLGLLMSWCLDAGSIVVEMDFIPWPVFAFCAFLGYCVLLWRRTLRRLPPGLKECKFVRLDYLRKMVRNGEKIRRCQELPSEAFGDPRKALHLIVVSHRWLDRYRCDVATPEFPEGLRLRTMLSKLESHFSLKSFGAGSGLADRFNHFCSSLVGGNDVLVFFDFMCLPQEGLDADGRLLERSEEEQHIFDTCLRQMSVLYSMFPVMVCDEVATGCTGYLDSGWCYSEVTVANLGKQLQFLSSLITRDLQLTPMPSLLEEDAIQELKTKFEIQLETKCFFNKNDRNVVRSIFDGFLLKAELRDAIELRNAAEVHRVLSEIRKKGLETLLDQPIDRGLNTLLHLAVRRRFREATIALLEFGANARLRNLAGDTPWQWKMFPRLCNAAARACMTFKESTADGVPMTIIGSADIDTCDGDMDLEQCSTASV